MKLDGTVAVVTGAGGGIGRELVVSLVRRGARVAAVDLDRGRLDGTVATAAAGDRVSAHSLNVADRDAAAALPSAVVEAHGAVDVLINNAGVIQPFVRVVDLDFAVIDRMIDVNLHGPVNLCKAFLPRLLARPTAHIANVSSMGGYLPVPGQTMYGAAKAGVRLFTEGLYAELADTRVGVSVVMPGGIATDITTNSGVAVPGASVSDGDAASRRLTSPRDAATTILDGIEADRFHIYIGTDAKLMQLAVKVAPRAAIALIRRQMGDLLDR